MDFRQVLDLPSRQARILRAVWFVLPFAIVLDCVVMGVLAVQRRNSVAAYGSLLATASRVHTLAFWCGLVPLVARTVALWWRQRSAS